MAALPTIDWESVAWNLKDHLETTRQSLRSLQKKIGVDKATLSRISRAKPCTPEAYVAVCIEMGADPTYFFSFEEIRDEVASYSTASKAEGA